MPTITFAPCLWFDSQAEEAAQYYVSIFKNSRINAVTRYSEVGQETHHRPAGSVMTVEFELDGLHMTALNGGPLFKFSEAVSLQVYCDTQEQIDEYWDKLGRGGDPKDQVCGWVKDKYGFSWQVVPRGMSEMLKDASSPGAKRAMDVVMKSKKLDIAALKKAYEGE